MPLLSACGAVVLYRSRAFLLLGALDADFFAYLDDLALCPFVSTCLVVEGPTSLTQ